jgi:hypothetical protein
MKKALLHQLLLISLITFNSIAQEPEKKEEFKPTGKPIARVFSNFHQGLAQDNSAFELTRVYLGYQYQISPEFSGNVTFDVGNPGVGGFEQTAYVKFGYLSYKKNKFKTMFGLIPTLNFGVQEKFWGHRYIMKTHQDEYGMISSADAGVCAEYKFNDHITMDAMIQNGEGYKKLQHDKTYREVVGLTINIIDGLTLRGVYDYTIKKEAQQTIATFLGYNHKDKIISGIEYNMQLGNKYRDGYDYSGYSAYTSYNINSKYQIFGRYDYISSVKLANQTNPWRYNSNGSLIMGGIQFSPIKQVKMALNYQLWQPENKNLSKSDYIFLNLEFYY